MSDLSDTITTGAIQHVRLTVSVGLVTRAQQVNTVSHDQRPLTGSRTFQRSISGSAQSCSSGESI